MRHTAKKFDKFDLSNFFIHCKSNGISSAVRLYIIKCDKSHLYLITPLGVHFCRLVELILCVILINKLNYIKKDDELPNPKTKKNK